MRRLTRIVIVVVVLLVAADFGVKILVENLAGRALASRRGVNGSVDVSFGGFPFLLHLKDREFSSVTIEAEDVRSGGFGGVSDLAPSAEGRIDSVRLELRDVAVEGDVWRDDHNGAVTAASGGGTASVGGAALNRLVPEEHDVRLTLLEDAVRVTGEVPNLGTQAVEVPEDRLRLEPGAGGGALVIDAPAPIGSIAIPLPQLVEGLTFRRLDVADGRIDLTFVARDVRVEL